MLDQYAYKDVPFSSIRAIFQEVRNAEVLLTFNVDSLIDYLSEREENRKALQNIDLEKYIPWAKLPSFKATMRHEWQHLIQRFLAEGILKESGAEFMTVFFITPFGANPRTYWFIHLAKSYRANAVMKEIHWKYGNHFSHAMTPALFVGYDTKRDIQVTDQQNLGFGEEHFFDNVTGKRIERAFRAAAQADLPTACTDVRGHDEEHGQQHDGQRKHRSRGPPHANSVQRHRGLRQGQWHQAAKGQQHQVLRYPDAGGAADNVFIPPISMVQKGKAEFEDE